jgi:hypothetical protein
MSGNTNVAETWSKIYTAFQDINFSAWDFDSIKKSLLDYLKTYYPEESFNDYIESSELIAQVEIFAYICELFAYRLDLNAHESLITQASRKDSVLALARLISYNASRNIGGKGLVKITSVSTSEHIFDSYGNDLSNVQIIWNDPNNNLWKDQFLTVMNLILVQQFGTLNPSDIIQIENIVFELYDIANNQITNNVLSYNISVSGNTYPMEIVSSDLNSNGPYERRPEAGMLLSCLYLNDGLGDSSNNTGFFFFTKQGTLGRIVTTFDGITPNQKFTVSTQNTNNNDIWINNINPTTGLVLTTNQNSLSSTKSGYWHEVDVTNGQNIIFNTSSITNKYEINTLINDTFQVVFGDGNFSAIPSGTFEIWSRTSANLDLIIPTTSIQNTSLNFGYNDVSNNKQTFSFTFSLLESIQNASATETIEHIKSIAPSYYYSQDRMVNGPDYNQFPLQDNSILKLNSINRTFSGDSKYIAWNDPTGYYQNVKMFSDDGVIYFDNYLDQQTVFQSSLPPLDNNKNTATASAIFNNYVAPILQTQAYNISAIMLGISPNNVRTYFTEAESRAIISAIGTMANNMPFTIWLIYDQYFNTWSISNTLVSNYMISISWQSNYSWIITLNASRIIIHSDNLNFWTVSYNEKTIDYNTLNANYDQIVILAANIGTNNSVLNFNYPINVISQYIYESGPNLGSPSTHDLIGIPNDLYNYGVPQYVNLSFLINPDNYVYFNRTCTSGCSWTYVPNSPSNYQSWLTDQQNGTNLWRRNVGAENVNFMWKHVARYYNLIDPAPTNLVDMYILTRGYYSLVQQWLNGLISNMPTPPSPYELRVAYGYLLGSKMISDDVILHSGKIKPIFGPLADSTLQATIQAVISPNTTKTTNQIKTNIVNAIQQYFSISRWNFGQSFYFTDMAAYVQSAMSGDILSLILIPNYNGSVFGNLFQVNANFDEIIQANITPDQVQIVTSINPATIGLG